MNDVINEVLESEPPAISTSVARKAEFVKQIKQRIENKTGIRRTIEALRCIPLVWRFYKKEANE